MNPAVYLLNACLSVAYAFLKDSPDKNWVSCPRAPENFGRERRKMIVFFLVWNRDLYTRTPVDRNGDARKIS